MDAKRLVVQFKGKDGDKWTDVLYTSDQRRAQRYVDLAMKYNPRVKIGRVVDTAQKHRIWGNVRK